MIEIICVRGEGDKRVSDVQDALVSSEHIAVRRGTSIINEKWYKRHSRRIRVPFQDGCYIARAISVTDGHLNISGNHVITSNNIRISPDGIWQEITIEQYEDGESDA